MYVRTRKYVHLNKEYMEKQLDRLSAGNSEFYIDYQFYVLSR